MRLKTLFFSLLLLAASLTFWPALGHAQNTNSNASDPTIFDAEKQAAITKAKQRQQGRILRMEKRLNSYRFKMLDPQGRIRTIDIMHDRGMFDDQSRLLTRDDIPKYQPHIIPKASSSKTRADLLPKPINKTKPTQPLNHAPAKKTAPSEDQP